LARISSVAPNSDLIDSAADGTDGFGGAEEHDTVSVATAMSVGINGVIDLRFGCMLPRSAVSTAPIALALEFHGVLHAGDAGNLARDALG